MDLRTVAVYGGLLVLVAALAWPQGRAARAVASVGAALRGTLAGDGTTIGAGQ